MRFLIVVLILVSFVWNSVDLAFSYETRTASSPKILALMIAPRKRPMLPIMT